MKYIKWALKELGFNKTTDYQNRYINETNIRTAIYMSFIVIILEIWMIIRYVHERPGRTFLRYFDGESNYLLLFSTALILLAFSYRYIKNKSQFNAGKVIAVSVIILDLVILTRFVINNSAEMTGLKMLFGMKYHLLLLVLAVMYLLYECVYVYKDIRKDYYGQVINIIYAVICVGFGVETSIYDVSNDRQILCFVTMLLFVACMLIWKPYVSAIIMGGAFLYFYSLWLPHLIEIVEAGGKVREGDTINYFMLWIVLVMISFSIYHQRRIESEKEETLERISVEDDLTGIHNMVWFNKEAEEILKNPATDLEKKIFLFLNIENFKTYNDQFGYQSGNEYLINLARVIRESFDSEPVARQSDDHFVVLADSSTGRERVEKIRAQVHSQNEEVYLELKVGGYRPLSRDTDPRVAVDCARYACSLTKNKFGENFKEYDKDVDSRFHMNQYIVNHIDRAVANGDIKVYYQPVVWSDTRELCGLEALARWNDPKYGFLSPGVFIPVLEEYRQIHKLDACIFKQVCENMRSALDNGRTIVPVSLNFSRLDFELMDAVGELEKYVEEYGISKDYLHVEVTESALMDDDGILSRAMDRLHKDGFSIWLDDFGSGYSSLNVLKDFSFDLLKIDMKFLTNFENNEKSRIILDTIIRLADGIGMKSLTEGVETDEAATFLSTAGCGRLQGYLFGKPMPLKELEDSIDSGKYVISDTLI
ncbi:MAG: EAL domain-containing protein [Lachnospiraceae bacterium]|nr:EAL domain-containing protein [Lachnospiraceae bacterium]